MSAKKVTATDPKPAELSFETLLAEIDTLVAKLESGTLSLEDSLSAFERASALSVQAQGLVEAAEQRLAKLVKRESGLVELPLAEPDDADADDGEDL